MSDLQIIAAFGGFLALLLALLLTRSKPAAPPELPEGAILVDGSNVMHWGGEPSLTVLRDVIASLEEQGQVPFVCFDANVGYKLFGAFTGSGAMAGRLGLPAEQVLVVDKGVTADDVILNLAREHGVQIVSNDRFRDWEDQFPQVKDPDRFRRGSWKGGSVRWRAG